MKFTLKRPPWRRVCRFAVWIVTLQSLFGGGGSLSAQQPPLKNGLQAVSPSASVSNTLAVEQETLAELKTQRDQLERTRKEIDLLINEAKIQLSAHANLLLLAKVDPQKLAAAQADNLKSIETLQVRLNLLKEKATAINLLERQTRNQLEMNRAQLVDLQKAGALAADQKPLLQVLHQLVDLLKTKEKILADMQAVYRATLERLDQAVVLLNDLATRFRTQIVLRKKQQRLRRNPSPLVVLNRSSLKRDLDQLLTGVRNLARSEEWRRQFRTDSGDAGALGITFLILCGVWQGLLVRFRRFLIRLRGKLVPAAGRAARAVCIDLLQKRLYLSGFTLFVLAIAQISPIYGLTPFARMLLWILAVWVFTNWWQDVLRRAESLGWGLPAAFADGAVRLVRLIRIFAILYLMIYWLAGGSETVLLLLRILFEAVVTVWVFFLSSRLSSPHESSRGRSGLRRPSLRVPGRALAVVIPSAALLLEFIGYGNFALYWLISWGLTFVVALGSGLCFAVLREVSQQHKLQMVSGGDGGSGHGRAIRWVLIQFGWLIWIGASLVGILVAWGSKQSLLVNMLRMLNRQVTIGKLSFSLMSFVYAFLILVLTNALTRTLKFVLRDRVLADSGLESGLQDSITTITVYSLWVFGILIALHAFGFGTTTLAVGFGALGIGLGFGLQNIFNNFISGIILLIERPIQVGDDVEVDGVWATVRKINVRSTVVQTYDNASLIIPNSEFISQQVTNWSFKDKRLRRNIDVGVAYGSDTEAVRRLLLEIAAAAPAVLKTPRPDVLFRDFGDSALIFRLRIWTDIARMLQTETAIRFEIDRVFKENGIVIAFPQRDVHLFVQKEPDPPAAE